jgi:ankyrin repeat protein
VVKLLLEQGADPALAHPSFDTTCLVCATAEGRLEVVRSLLGHPSGKATIDHRDGCGLATSIVWGSSGR